MAVCQDCKQEMRTSPGCTVDALIIHRERFDRDRIRRPIGPADRCGDCGAQKGGFHHLGCDMEPCPRCRRQLLSCGCPDVPDDDDAQSLIAVIDDTVVYPDALRGLRVPRTRFPFGQDPTASAGRAV
jgi:hypothetical protein